MGLSMYNLRENSKGGDAYKKGKETLKGLRIFKK